MSYDIVSLVYKQRQMKKYTNYIRINGQVFTHTIIADSYKEALQISFGRKIRAKMIGREIFGRLVCS